MLEPDWRLLPPDQAVLVVVAPATLTHESADPLRLCVERRLPNRDDAGLILDLSAVRLITSIGIAALLQIDEFCRLRGASYRLANLAEEQVAFLQMLRLDHKFPRSASVEDAAAELSR